MARPLWNRVRVGVEYEYQPVLIDVALPSIAGKLTPGDRVRVYNVPGCPPANTMGHCYVYNAAGEFCGLVHCNSLKPIKKGVQHVQRAE